MLISGIQKFTVTDFPDHTACILFTAGCNFRCGYCHNSEFVLPEKLKELRDSFIDHKAALSFLEARKGLLEGVVISGGEPTMMPDLLDWIRTIKSMGFKVKLDTNGTKPQLVQEALDKGLLDYVAMDIKAPMNRYEELAGVTVNHSALNATIDLLKGSSIAYEFRSVLIKGFHSIEDIHAMIDLASGANRYRFLRFRPDNTLCAAFTFYKHFSLVEMKEFISTANNTINEVIYEP